MCTRCSTCVHNLQGGTTYGSNAPPISVSAQYGVSAVENSLTPPKRFLPYLYAKLFILSLYTRSKRNACSCSRQPWPPPSATLKCRPKLNTKYTSYLPRTLLYLFFASLWISKLHSNCFLLTTSIYNCSLCHYIMQRDSSKVCRQALYT